MSPPTVNIPQRRQPQESMFPSPRHPTSTNSTQIPVLSMTNYRRHRGEPGAYSDMLMPVKPVYKLTCKHCHTIVCSRGMKAILLADASVQLFSTDTPSPSVYLLDKDYLTRTCHCRIRDVSCTLCGNIIGYHVVSPCHQCLKSSNNGHFWMFHSQACDSIERLTATGKELLIWNNLPGPEKDIEFLMSGTLPYDQICR